MVEYTLRVLQYTQDYKIQHASGHMIIECWISVQYRDAKTERQILISDSIP